MYLKIWKLIGNNFKYPNTGIIASNKNLFENQIINLMYNVKTIKLW